MNNISIDKGKQVVDTIVNVKAVDAILETMDHGFGEVIIKVTVQNGVIKVIGVTKTKTVRFE